MDNGNTVPVSGQIDPLQDSSLETPVTTPVVSATPDYEQPHHGILSLQRRKKLLLINIIILAMIAVVGTVSYLFFSNTSQTPVSKSQKIANFKVSKLPVDNVKPNGLLGVGTADQLTINGQVNVGNTLVLTPTATPGKPVAGQLYYDQANNTPYYYNGSRFVSLAPQAAPSPNPAGVTSLGGSSGSIGLSTGLVLSGGQLGLQLQAGNGVSISGNTITNTGVVNILPGSSNISVSKDSSGNYTISDSTIGFISGTGTAGQLPLFTTGQSLGDSILGQSGNNITDSGTLTVQGAATVDSLAATNGISGGSLSISGAASVNTLAVTGTSTFTGQITANGGLTVTGNITQNGSGNFTTGTGNVSLQGNTSISNGKTLTVGTGLATFNGGLTVASGDLAVTTGNLNIGSGNLTIDSSGNLVTAGTVTADILQSISNNQLNVSAGSGVISFTAGGINFVLPTTGTGTQTICTSSTVGCAQGGGTAVILGPNNGTTSTAQTDNSANSIFIHNNNGGNLLNLEGGNVTASQSFLVDNAGNTTIAGTLAVQAANSLTLGSAGKNGSITFNNSTNSNTVTLQSGVTTTNGLTFTLPTHDGLGNQCIRTDGSGNLNFSDCAAGSGVTTVGTLDGETTPSSDGATIVSGTLIYLQSASATAPGLVNTLNGQVFAGSKTFNGDLTAAGAGTGLSVTNSATIGTGLAVNSGGITVTAGGLTVSAGGATITGNSTIAGSLGSLTGLSSSGTITFSGLNTAGIVTNTAGGQLGTVATLGVSNGGTGTGSLTLNGILYGNGTSAIQATSAAANSILATDGSNVPGLTQTLPTAVQNNITTVGNLSQGSIISGFGTITTGQNITTSATVQGSSLVSTGSLSLGTTGSATGSILFKGATGASGTLTLIGPANPTTNTLTLPNETGTLCSTGSICSGYAASSPSGAYVQLQAGTPGTPQTGNLNISGTGILGALSVTNGTTIGNGLTVSAGGLTVTGNSTITGTLGSLTGLSSSGTITFSGLNTAGIVTNTAGGQLGTVATLGVSNGGTGVGTFTTNGVLYGNGTGILQATAAGTGGQLLLANSSGVPTFTTLGGDASITNANTGALTVNKLQGNTLTLPTLGVGNAGQVLQVNGGGSIVNGFITNANLQAGNFNNITGVGTLTGGLNIASGQTYKINGVDINTAGTLTNVAYLNQANTFTTGTNTFSANGTALAVTGTPAANSTSALLQLGNFSTFSGTSTGAYIGINGSNTNADLLNLQVLGALKLKVDSRGALTSVSSGTFGSTLAVQGTASGGNTLALLGANAINSPNSSGTYLGVNQGANTSDFLNFQSGTSGPLATSVFKVGSTGATLATGGLTVGVNTGAGSGTTGQVTFAGISGSNTVTLQAPTSALGFGSSISLTLPSSLPTAGATFCMKSDSNGVLSFQNCLGTSGGGNALSAISNKDSGGVPSNAIQTTASFAVQGIDFTSGNILKEGPTPTSLTGTPVDLLQLQNNSGSILSSFSATGQFLRIDGATSNTYNIGTISQDGTVITGYGTAFTSNLSNATLVYNDNTSSFVSYDPPASANPGSLTTLTSSVPKFTPVYNMGTIAQSGTCTITGTGTTFTAGMNNDVIMYSDNTTAVVTFVNALQLTSSNCSKTVTAGSTYNLYPADFAYSTGTISQSGTCTITGTGTNFTSVMNGDTIVYNDNTTATVTVLNSTQLTSSNCGKTVTGGSTYYLYQPTSTYNAGIIFNAGTISQSGTCTITGTGTNFTSAANNDIIVYNDTTTATVTFVDATHLTSSNCGKTLTNTPYTIGPPYTISQSYTGALTIGNSNSKAASDGINLGGDTQIYRSGNGTINLQSASNVNGSNAVQVVTLQAGQLQGGNSPLTGTELDIAGGDGTGSSQGGNIVLQVYAPASTIANYSFASTSTAVSNGMAADSNGRFLWTAAGSGQIARIDATSGLVLTNKELASTNLWKPNGSALVAKSIADCNGALYFANNTVPQIGRLPFNTTTGLATANVTNAFVTGGDATGISSLTCEVINGTTYLFWSDSSDGNIGYVPVDSSGNAGTIVTQFIHPANLVANSDLQQVAIDPFSNNFLYFAAGGTTKFIQRADVSCITSPGTCQQSGGHPISNTDGSYKTSIAVGLISGLAANDFAIYWTIQQTNTLCTAPLSGLNNNCSAVGTAGNLPTNFKPGNIYATNTFLYFGSVTFPNIAQVPIGGTSPNSVSNVLTLSGLSGAAKFQNAVDSSTGFQILESQAYRSGIPLLTGDTLNSTISTLGQLTVQGGITASSFGSMGSVTLSSSCSGGTCTNSYTYVVTAVNGGGGSTLPSAPATITSSNLASAPITIKWSPVNGAASYNIYRTISDGTATYPTGLIASIGSQEISSAGKYSFNDFVDNTTIISTASPPTVDTSGQLTAKGTALFQNAANSTTSFQVQNVGGTTILDVDTQNTRVGIGTNAPGNLLSIGALTTANGTNTGAQIAVSTGGTTNSGIIVQNVAGQSGGNAFLLQDSTASSVLASIDYQGNLTVKAATINGLLTVNGHIKTANSSGSTAGVGLTGACSVAGANPTVTGDDTAGLISYTTANSGTCAGAPGALLQINFANSYGAAPYVVLTAASSNAPPLQFYIDPTSVSISSFTLNVLSNASTNTTYKFYYHIFQ